jgi:hypothetical protein
LAIAFIGLALCLLSGCNVSVAQPEPEPEPKKIQMPAAQAEQVGKGEELEPQNAHRVAAERNKPVEVAQAEGRADRAIERGQSRQLANASFDELQALDQISAEIRDSLSLRKTLVVWIVEQTSEAMPLAKNVAERIPALLEDLHSTDGNALEMAVVTYGDQVNVLTPEPVEQASAIRKALQMGAGKRAEKIMLNTALQQAADKFLPFRKRGFEVLFVVVGVASGDDREAADQAIASLARAAVPVYAIAPAIPFGKTTGLANGNRGQKRPSILLGSDKRWFESSAPERIQLGLSGNQSTADLTDSGYGPFGMERACRLTGGKLFRLREGRAAGWEIDPNTGDIKAELLAKYAPDYVSDEQYQQLLTENKCRMALHNASLLPEMTGLESPRTNFPKEKDEAAMAKTVGIAQRASAEHDQPIQKLYDTLNAGQADRPKLTGARWQAAYDLAMGQCLAAKARIDGYNAMLAILKQGKSFTNPDSKRWMLEPADEIAAGSVLEKMAKNSRTYLQRVVQEHKGTPWAAIAERELKYPAGWKFVEQ